MTSSYSNISGSESEVECVGKIRVVSRDSTIPCHTNRSLDSGTNTEGVFVAQLHRKRRVDRCLESSRLDSENNLNSILSHEDLSPRKDLVVISRNPTSVKEWKDRYFFTKDFTELDSGEPSEFFIPQSLGAPSNHL